MSDYNYTDVFQNKDATNAVITSSIFLDNGAGGVSVDNSATVILKGVLSSQNSEGVATGEGNNVIHLKASSFEFEPNNIRIPKPGPLTVEVENISGIEHNFTIKNPEGQVLKSFVLSPKETISETLNLTDIGNYEFYCDKTFHATLGMKGQIQVGP